MQLNKVQRGSKTAKDGFKNEQDVVDKFNNWENEEMAQGWLEKMGYSLAEIEYVKAEKIKGSYKADVQVKVEIKLKKLVDIQNLQVKLVSNDSGYNQIDKRWIDTYAELWDMSSELKQVLKYFTGELPPYIPNTRNTKRMFISEFSEVEQDLILSFFNEKKILVLTDLLKGRGKFSAEWMLVIVKSTSKETRWALHPINYVLNFYDGPVEISKQGSLKIGKITMQRKGGDGGRITANMLQFKMDPTLLLN